MQSEQASAAAATIEAGVPATKPKRPLRLIVVAAINIVTGLMAVVVLIFMLTSPKVPAELVPEAWGAVFSLLITSALIVSSLLALVGLPSARKPALVIGLVYFGVILLKHLFAAIDPQSLTGEMPTDAVRQKLWAGVVRTLLEIGLTWWGFQSAKTKAFFESRRAEA
jgi:hypothetical protein